MDESVIPSAAIIAGSLARTYEYRTAGVAASPQVRWTFPARQDISCAVLLEHGIVYIGDKEGYFSAIDAQTGEIRWSFATSWARGNHQPNWRDPAAGVTASCLAGRFGYAACATGTLYELDLHTGQAQRCWFDEAQHSGHDNRTIRALAICNNLLLVSKEGTIEGIDCSTSQMLASTFCLSTDQAYGGHLPIYQHSEGRPIIIYGDEMISNHGDYTFVSVSFSGDEGLWYEYCLDEGGFLDKGGLEKQEDSCNVITEIGLPRSQYNLPILEGVLYTLSRSTLEEREEGLLALVALDASTGAQAWSYLISSDSSPILLVAAYGLVFLVFQEQVEAIDVQTQHSCWVWQSRLALQHAFVAEGLFYAFGEKGQLIVLEASTGLECWRWQAEQPLKGQLSTIADRSLYIVMGHVLCALS